MKLYTDIKRISDIQSSNNVLDDMFVLLANQKKNYKFPLSQLQQTKIVSLSQTDNKTPGELNPITLSLRDNSKFRIYVRNGSLGKTGDQGDKGEQGDKGDNPVIDERTAQLKGVKDWLYIANDTSTEDNSKLFSALQGIRISDAVDLLSETFLSEYQYALLFTDHVTIDAEFETVEDGELVQLIYQDNDSHKRYTKYWTYENEGSEEYFVFNYFGNSYDSVYCDLWEDIYLGGNTGYYKATSEQLTDGNDLYVVNNADGGYTKIDAYNSLLYKATTINGEPGYLLTDITDTERPLYIQSHGEFVEASDKYINTNLNKSYRQRDFEYILPNTKLEVKVNYTLADGYNYTLVAKELDENIYIFDHVDNSGNKIYNKITFSQADPDSTTVYYYKTDDGDYEIISDVATYIKTKTDRYFRYVEGIWVEVDSIDDIDIDNFETYLHVNYISSSNTYIYTKYTRVQTLRDTYYSISGDTLNNYSIIYYVQYTSSEPRRYYTRTITTIENEDGSTGFDYIYKEITIPFWLECEFTTEDEDETIQLITSDTHYDTDEEQVVDTYIKSIEFESDVIEIAKNMNKNIPVIIEPTNASVSDMILEYNEDDIEFYEDGRIGAILNNDEITKETIVKVYSERDEKIGDSIKVRIVTPVDSISLNTNQINLYPGSVYKLTPTISPTEVTNGELEYSFSDNTMLAFNKNTLEVTPLKQADGSYSTGTCQITVTAKDGFGASVTVPVLVAIPITNIEITSGDHQFVGHNYQISTNVYPEDATEKSLEYSSDNEDVLTINDYGVVTVKSEGNATITASAKDGSGIIGTQNVKVTTGVESISIENLDDSIEVGLYNTIDIYISPDNATNKDIQISFTDTDVVDINNLNINKISDSHYQATIKAIKGGATNISVTSQDGMNTSISKDITIPTPIEQIGFETPSVVLYTGDDATLIKTIVTGRDNVTNQSLTWLSSNINISTVDTNGRVKPVKPGTCKISAISNDANAVVGTCNIIVKRHVDNIILNDGDGNSIQVLRNNYGFIPARVVPDNATDQILKFTSSDESICTVEDNGTIFGKKLGEVIITATSADNRTDSIGVKVVTKIINTQD